MGLCSHEQRTNERRYESKDSREMEKCSMSPKLLLVSVDVRERYFRGHWPFSSGGDGCTGTQLVCCRHGIRKGRYTYREVDTTIIDHCCSDAVLVDFSGGLVTSAGAGIGDHAPLILYSPVS